jgi:hypothetical protein
MTPHGLPYVHMVSYVHSNLIVVSFSSFVRGIHRVRKTNI